ncbi:MAG: transglycosylase domain-containing protein [Defluviitaleaceae bacterium]|nr:transglycosylase domain-containing protein [Defluviitaleaceae bacterium]
MDYSSATSKLRARRISPNLVRVRNTVGVMAFRVAFAVILIAGFAAVGAGVGVYLGILRNAPVIDLQTNLRSEHYNSIIFEGRTGVEIARLTGEENREFAPISRMPQHLLNAFVAIEDERFFTHNGIDIRGMARALHNNVTSDSVEGASTITQQVIKNILGLTRNDLVSKLQEQYMAVQFEQALTELYGSREIAKEIILEAYLNIINLGRNWHGVQVAAWNYFGKDVSELTLSESAVIAGITRNPSRYLPDRFPENNRARQRLVLGNMLRLEMITQEEFFEAMTDPVHDRVLSGLIAEQAHGVVHSYFTDALIEQVIADLMDQHMMTRANASALVFGGGLQIFSTQDLRIQEIMDNTFADENNFPVNVFEIVVEYSLSARNEITNQVSNHSRTATLRNEELVEAWLEETRNELLTASDLILAENILLTPQPQAAMVMMDHHNGHVIAISGGRGEKHGSRHFNRATIATRSPGSQFKVLSAFLPGIDMGTLHAGTHIVDQHWVFEDPYGFSEDYVPRNWWGVNFEGPTSVRRAIYRSANVVSAQAFQIVGPNNAFEYLLNLGFTTLEGTLSNERPFRDNTPAVPLGGLTRGVTQLELAAAYATIANNGYYNRPVFYSRVLDQNGNVILENTSNPRRVISPPAAFVLTDMMRDTVRGVAGATGANANFRNINVQVAGKTGTSQNVEDLGFTGYTPFYTAAIWLGFDRPRALNGVPSSTHLIIWREIMEQAHIELGLTSGSFVQPDGVITAAICRVTGLLPTDACRRAGTVVTDLVVAVHMPTLPCTGVHHAYTANENEEYGEGEEGEMGDIISSPDFLPGGGGFWGGDVPQLPTLPDTEPPTDTQPDAGGNFWGTLPLPTPVPPPTYDTPPIYDSDADDDIPWWDNLPAPEPEPAPVPVPEPPAPPSVEYLPPPIPEPEPELPPPPPIVEPMPAVYEPSSDDDDDLPGWF